MEISIYRPDILKRVAVFCGIGIIILIGLAIRWHYAYLAYNFNGRVDSIRYGDKGTAIIVINQKEYYLDGSWSYSPNNKFTIQKGDSMLKFKNSTQVELIKVNGQKIVQ